MSHIQPTNLLVTTPLVCIGAIRRRAALAAQESNLSAHSIFQIETGKARVRRFRLYDTASEAVVYGTSKLYQSHDGPTAILRMNSSSLPSQCLPPNPDISGLGVRISFYVQTLALGKWTVFWALSGRSLEEAHNTIWTLLGTSFGLTISAFVTALKNDLPLYQAVVVTDLVFLANWAIFMALATYNRHPRGSHAVQHTAIGQTYISMSLILYLWARAPTLDAEFEAAQGETKFVVLFISTSATGAGRVAALVMTTLLLIGYSIPAITFLWGHPPSISFLRKRSQQPSTQLPRPSFSSSQNSHPTPPLTSTALTLTSTALTQRLLAPLPPAAHSSKPSPAQNLSLNGAPPTQSRLPPSLQVDPHLIILTLFTLIPSVITIGSTELQIQRNQLCPDNAFWGFGQVNLFLPIHTVHYWLTAWFGRVQILAITVTIVPVAVTIKAFWKQGLKQRKRAKENAAAANAAHV
ncbi:F-box domain-containing protein [Mycena venus]|uniref:F-box domain-containing protein n=1 Tax=Mycena venus TaxID=2733690 RepID=A0A8H7D5W9_9AGAR|nr:F-box domain-containing protein [Mycena venus]